MFNKYKIMASGILWFVHLVVCSSPMGMPKLMAPKPYRGENNPDIRWKRILEDNVSYHPDDVRKYVLEMANLELKTAFKVIKDSDSFDMSHNCLLLYGKTGTGKTVMAQTLVQESGKYYTFLNAINLMDPYRSTVRRALSKVIKKYSDRPHIVVLDNIDCFTEEHVQTFKNFLQECKKKNKFVIAITEKLESLPQEIRRFFTQNNSLVSVDAVKTNVHRKQILLSSLKVAHNCDDYSLDLLMTRLNKYSHRSLLQVAELAYESAWLRSNVNVVIALQDFYAAIKKVEEDAKILAGDDWQRTL